jgi:uncharacterized damage-inducible protein DinB
MLFEEFLDRLDAMCAEIEQAIEGLPPAALDWVPGPDMNSLGVLVVHVVGAARYWIGDVVARDPSGRDRQAEFQTRGVDANTLKKRLVDLQTYARSVCEKLTPGDLEEIRISPRNNWEFTVAWSLLHALEHTAIHVGHIQMLRQLWDQRQQNS